MVMMILEWVAAVGIVLYVRYLAGEVAWLKKQHAEQAAALNASMSELGRRMKELEESRTRV